MNSVSRHKIDLVILIFLKLKLFASREKRVGGGGGGGGEGGERATTMEKKERTTDRPAMTVAFNTTYDCARQIYTNTSFLINNQHTVTNIASNSKSCKVL